MDKAIKNLGKLSGKVLVFGGVYSNLQALEALIEFAEENNIRPENCICTGDIVGYCAQPNESVLRLKLWGAISILGNVEIQLKEGEADCGCDFKEGSRCDLFSRNWFAYSQKKISHEALNFISELPGFIKFSFANKRIGVVHGSYQNVSEFIFKSTPWKIKKHNFELTQSDVIVAGHSGLPFCDYREDKIWLNPGVIGMPANDGKPHVWFAVLDDLDGNLNIKHFTLDYNYKLTSKMMFQNKLPEAYAKTIITGIWDNMEILPAPEVEIQGQEIVI